MRRRWLVEFLRECFGWITTSEDWKLWKVFRIGSRVLIVATMRGWWLLNSTLGVELLQGKTSLKSSVYVEVSQVRYLDSIWKGQLCHVCQRINERWSIENERVIFRVDKTDVARCLDGCTPWTYPFWVIVKLRFNQVVLRLASYT